MNNNKTNVSFFSEFLDIQAQKTIQNQTKKSHTQNKKKTVGDF